MKFSGTVENALRAWGLSSGRVPPTASSYFPRTSSPQLTPSPLAPWAFPVSPSPSPPSSCCGPLHPVAVAYASREDLCQVKCPKATWSRAWRLWSPPWGTSVRAHKAGLIGGLATHSPSSQTPRPSQHVEVVTHLGVPHLQWVGAAGLWEEQMPSLTSQPPVLNKRGHPVASGLSSWCLWVSPLPAQNLRAPGSNIKQQIKIILTGQVRNFRRDVKALYLIPLIAPFSRLFSERLFIFILHQTLQIM